MSIRQPRKTATTRQPRTRTRWMLAALLCLLLNGIAALQSSAHTASTDVSPVVYVLNFEGPITPVLEQYLAKAIETAAAVDAEAVVLQLDTPGGSIDVTKSITQLMLSSPVPIVVYVSPSGAHAGSAGTFITLSAHVAAMAPGSSIGAASPVDMSGNDMSETMQAKIKNILSADVENLASRRGDTATEWAIAAVREATAATASDALQMGVIDFIATDVDDLLAQINGFEVTVNGETYALSTADATLTPIELTPIQKLLNFLSNPTIAALLLSLGMLGLFIEIRTPGFGLPGIVGVISLLLALFGLGQMDANLVGMALIAAALALFVAEAFTPTFGVLAIGGAVAFVFGAALLFNTPGIQTPWTVIILLATTMGALVIFIGVKAYAAQRDRPKTGAEGLIGKTAIVKEAFDANSSGSVFIQGEWWNATTSSGAFQSGDQVRVLSMDGFTLLVEAIGRSPSDAVG